jgi:malate synthase
VGYVDKGDVKVAAELAAFIDDRALAGTGLDPAAFWAGFAALFARFAPENKSLLAVRDDLQAKIDAWHGERAGRPIDQASYPSPRRSR